MLVRQRLGGERPAIRDLAERGDYTLPASHREALGDMANLNNSIRHFLISSEVGWCEDATWEETHLYTAYYLFSRRAGAQPTLPHVECDNIRVITSFQTHERTLGNGRFASAPTGSKQRSG